MPIRIYFRVLSMQTRRCSLRIQAYRPKRAVTLAVCVFQIVARVSPVAAAIAGLGVLGPFGPRVVSLLMAWLTNRSVVSLP